MEGLMQFIHLIIGKYNGLIKQLAVLSSLLRSITAENGSGNAGNRQNKGQSQNSRAHFKFLAQV